MRAVAISILFACGCAGERPLHAKPLPPLQGQQQAGSIASAKVALWPGERMSWQVRWRGLAVGIASLEVTEVSRRTRVRSRFRATGFAARASGLNKVLVSELGESRRPGDIHSALGRVRGWAEVGAQPARLDVLHGGELYRVKLASPVPDRIRDEPALRIEGEAISATSQIQVTLWIRHGPDRALLQAIVARDGESIRAELIEFQSRR